MTTVGHVIEIVTERDLHVSAIVMKIVIGENQYVVIVEIETSARREVLLEVETGGDVNTFVKFHCSKFSCRIFM